MPQEYRLMNTEDSRKPMSEQGNIVGITGNCGQMWAQQVRGAGRTCGPWRCLQTTCEGRARLRLSPLPTALCATPSCSACPHCSAPGETPGLLQIK